MGYSTTFKGVFTLNKPADADLQRILKGLATTRRMKRKVDESIYGIEGEFFFKDDGFFGQTKDDTILEYNIPPRTQPSLWCQWELKPDNITIGWDETEKFYDYVPWIQYIIDRVLKPRGYILNGTVTWRGEEPNDKGKIKIHDNVVQVQVL